MTPFACVTVFCNLASVSSTHDPGGGVGERLRADIAAAGFTISGFARYLAGGPDASKEDHQSWRRYLTRWMKLTGHHGMRTDYAEILAEALGTDPGRYLSSQYDPNQQLERQAERLANQLQAVLKELGLERRAERLRDQVREVLEELDRRRRQRSRDGDG